MPVCVCVSKELQSDRVQWVPLQSIWKAFLDDAMFRTERQRMRVSKEHVYFWVLVLRLVHALHVYLICVDDPGDGTKSVDKHMVQIARGISIPQKGRCLSPLTYLDTRKWEEGYISMDDYPLTYQYSA